MLKVFVWILLFAGALTALCVRSRPASKPFRAAVRLVFSAAVLFALHRVSRCLPALNMPSLSAVSLLGPVGYGLIYMLLRL